MAKLLQAGEFATEGERRTAAELQKAPKHWVVISNKIIPTSNGRSFEVDFIVLADHWVFLLDEKSWREPISGNDQYWTLPYGEPQKSPLTKADLAAKVLAGALKYKVPALRDVPYFVQPGVVLSAATSKPVIRDDPRAKGSIFLLHDVCRYLQTYDEHITGSPHVGNHRDHIVSYLMGLENRPRIPNQIGEFHIDDLQTERPGVRIFHATLVGDPADPADRYTLMVYDLGHGIQKDEMETFYRREFEALRQLRNTRLAPETGTPFRWSDDSLALPIHTPSGDVLSARPAPATQEDVVDELALAAASFNGLAAIHAKEIVHRALGPDTIYVAHEGQRLHITFTNFYAARLGTHSIATTLQEFASQEPYAAPELQWGYGAAVSQSDTYSLGLIFLERLTGVKLNDLRQPDGAIAIPSFGDRLPFLSADLAQQTRDIFQGAVSHRPDERLTAADIAAFLDDLVRNLRAASKAKDMGTPRLLDGHFQVLRILGQGTSATTYLVEDVSLRQQGAQTDDGLTDRQYALKQFRDPASGWEEAKREWTALQHIKCVGLPNVYAVNDPSNDLSHNAQIQMEYIQGPTLQELENEFPWSLDRWRTFAADMLTALDELEKRDLLHRDIKPSNIILREEDGRPVLIDFGFAVRADAITAPAGSARFLPPETLADGMQSKHGDRFALAVVLYKTLTGFFPDQDADSIIPLLGVSDYERGAIARLLGVLNNAFDKHPEVRPESSSAFRARIEHALLAPPEPVVIATASGATDVIALRGQFTPVDEVVVSDEMTFTAIENHSPSPTLTEQINRTVADIRSLYRNSAAGNANNRGLDTDFVRETYTPTALDTALLPRLLAAPPYALFLSGNPGDGKTAFLEQVKARLVAEGATGNPDDPSGWELTLRGHTYRSCYDASEAHNGLTANQNLEGRLAGLEGSSAPTTPLTVMVAINDGRLYDFFERSQNTFGWLHHQVFAALRATSGNGGVRANDAKEAADGAVWVVDLKRRAFVLLPTEPASVAGDGVQLAPSHEARPARSVALQALDALVAPQRWSDCERCVAQDVCPIRQNAALLRRPVIGERLEYALLLTHLRRHRHITMRDLRSAYAYLITADVDCADVHAARSGPDKGASLAGRAYWQSAFAPTHASKGQAPDDLLAELARLDPARLAQPNLDRYLYFHQSERDSAGRRRLFADGRDVSPHSFADTSESPDTSAAWRRAFKRRLYFEGATDDGQTAGLTGAPAVRWRDLLPYRYAEEFLQALAGQTDQQETLRRLARGILRSDGVNVALAADRFGVVVKKSDAEQLIILKEFPLRDFTLEVSPKRSGQIVETIAEALILQARIYSASEPLPQKRMPALSVTLTLDHFELLMRLADGLQPGAPEYRPLLEDLVPFKSALLLREANDLTLIEGQSRFHRITQRDGKIVLTQNVQGATR